MPIVDTVILHPVIPFINVTEIRTLRSSSLNAHILGALLLWVFSLSETIQEVKGNPFGYIAIFKQYAAPSTEFLAFVLFSQFYENFHQQTKNTDLV